MPQPVDRKIIDANDLFATLRAERQAGRTVVQCHGCFDIVHPGHIRYLQFARQLGDILVVSLTGDEGIEKGPDRPYIPQELRAESLAALEFVDWVVIDPRPSACALLTALRPDVYVKGREYETSRDPRFLEERGVVEAYGGRVVFHSGDVVFSSTRLLESVRRDAQLDERRLRIFCARNEIDEPAVRNALTAHAGVPVVVVGDLIREDYIHCDATSTADDAPVLSLERVGAAEYWGGAAAVTLQLQALGAKPRLVAAVGEDAASSGLEARFAEMGIEARLLPVRPALIRRSTFVADENKLFKVNDGVRSPLDSTAEREALRIIREQLADARLLVWCDHGYGMLTAGLVRAATVDARKRGVVIAGHARGQWGQLGAFSDTDLLCATERRLREGMHDMSSGLPAVAWNLLSYSRGRSLIVGLHKRGLIGFEGRGAEQNQATRPNRLKSEFVSSPATHYVDLLGAEEAILATAALVIAMGGSLPMATYMAAAAEMITVSRFGGAPARTADLQAWFAQRPELRPESRFFPDAATLADIASLAPPLVPELTA